MLVMWFEHGRNALRPTGCHLPQAFVDRKGRPFLDSTFAEYWRVNVDKTSKDFFKDSPTATLLRSSFVNEYILQQHEDYWHGAAQMMGSSVRHWIGSYSTNFTQERVKKATQAHRKFREKALALPRSR